MAITDSVSIFAEGTFEEQIQELVNYIVRNRPDEERAAFIRPFQDSLKTEEGAKSLEEDVERRRKVFGMVLDEVKDLGEGSEKEIEGYFNLIYSHLFSLYPAGSVEIKQAITDLLGRIYGAPSDSVSIKFRILSNLFNALPRTSPERIAVYSTLLDLAVENDNIGALQLSRADVEKWLSEWDVTPEQKSTFLKIILDAYAKSNQPTTSYEYALLHLSTLPPTSSEAQEAAVSTITTALRLPSVFDFDPLFKLEAVVAVAEKEQGLFSLLKIFLNDGLKEFNEWATNNGSALQKIGLFTGSAFEKLGLDRSELERKIRLLTLASLAFKNVGKNLPYSEIVDALQVDPSEVEKWVIDTIRTGLISGKLSQTTQSLHITRSTARAFERAQWEALEARLIVWKAGLAGVLEVVKGARRQGGAVQSVGA